jgi:cell surface protein SprA
MRFDFTLRDNVTVNHRLDQNIHEPSMGSRTIAVNPRITYIVSKSLDIELFMNRTRTIPKTSASFPLTRTEAGLRIRFSLAL